MATNTKEEMIEEEQNHPFAPPNFSEDMTDEEKAIAEFSLEGGLSQVPLKGLAMAVADEIFGEKLDNENEFTFLNAPIDETQPIQAEFSVRINEMFEGNGFHESDRIVFQTFRRKAGYPPSAKVVGQYMAAVCLKETQVVRFGGEENILTEGSISRFFKIEPKGPRPCVPKYCTRITFPKEKGQKERSTIKSRKYLCFLVWAFWDGEPIKPKEKTTDNEKLVEKLKEMNANLPSGVEALQKSGPSPEQGREIVIDSEEPKTVKSIEVSNTMRKKMEKFLQENKDSKESLEEKVNRFNKSQEEIFPIFTGEGNSLLESKK